MFARYGAPYVLVSDNGPQFASAEFASFARKWGFEHIASSPRYPQSNGKAENAVKTVKRLFTKCRETRQSEFHALLDWRNTPTEGVGTSPSQRFLGRCCKTLLPMTGSLLNSRYPTEDDAHGINRQKQRQQHYYDRQVKPLKPIDPGDTVRMRLPGKTSWSARVCRGLVGPRSYEVEAGGNMFTRNRHQLIRVDKLPPQEIPDIHVEEHSTVASQQDNAEDVLQAPSMSPQKTQCTSSSDTEHSIASPAPLRRSGRNCKPPEWITNYVPS